MSKFMGLDEDGSLVTAAKTYSNGDKEVTLAGCVHVGEEEYYTELKEYLEGLDMVLWEGATVEEPKTFGGKMIKHLGKYMSEGYRKLAKELDIEYQYSIIDTKSLGEKWVHCDMGTDELAKELFNSPDELVSLGLSSAFMNMGVSPGREQFKRQIVSYNDEPEFLEVILWKRNGIVKKKLAEFAGEEGKKNVGVFYGAAHMPDLEEFLGSLGFSLKEEKWFKAVY